MKRSANNQTMGDKVRKGTTPRTRSGLSRQVDNIATKLRDSELKDTLPQTPTNLLRNLTEIQVVKKGKGKRQNTKEKVSTVTSTEETRGMSVGEVGSVPCVEAANAGTFALPGDGSHFSTFDYSLVNTVQQGCSETLCIIPDAERNIPDEEIEADNLINQDPEQFMLLESREDVVNTCEQCCLPRKCKFKLSNRRTAFYVCDDSCLDLYKRIMKDKVVVAEWSPYGRIVESVVSNKAHANRFSLNRKCMECDKAILGEEANLSWEAMDFCNESCLALYQRVIGSLCSYCQAVVQHTSMGKYCVRFGYNVRQFCSNICLEEFKKGLKLCSYCQKDMSGEDGFLAPIGDKAQFKEFCTKLCMEKYDAMSNNRIQPLEVSSNCAVCRKDKQVIIEYVQGIKTNSFCGEPCFVAYKFVNHVEPEKCNMCQKYFDARVFEDNSVYINNVYQNFCSKSCLNIYITTNRRIVACNWCKVKKYNFDMIQRKRVNGTRFRVCSLNCLNLYQVSQSDSTKRIICSQCHKNGQALYHLRLSDSSMKNFCSYTCVMTFQRDYALKIGFLDPKRTAVGDTTAGGNLKKSSATKDKSGASKSPVMPIITNVESLAETEEASTESGTKKKSNTETALIIKDKETTVPPAVPATPPPSTPPASPTPPPTPPPIIETRVKHQYIIKTPLPPVQRNVATMCKVITSNKEATCIPDTESIEIQTDDVEEKTKIFPMPVPLYIPAPAWMYSTPYPVPFPFPLPLPVPIFIPTTKGCGKGLMKEIEKTQIKIPTNPLEADLLMMAEMIAADKKEEDVGSEDENVAGAAEGGTYSPEPDNAEASFGEDGLQSTEPAVDLEEDQQAIHTASEDDDQAKGRKRGPRSPRKAGKRGRRASSYKNTAPSSVPEPPAPPPPPPEPAEKPDANMCLKYTFGVNAWKQWVALKNAEIERSSHRGKLFKPEILQLTADELNYSLCLFVKEVRKPNGQEYAPDTIYYLCLGIQQYLLENARIDNIFCDAYYERFTDCLDEVARKFSVLYNDAHYIVTRVEEEHLWESKQLGAHSPHVLLTTLMFFNTKHFNLASVEEHMQLSFSHIMKHWKRSPNPTGTKVPGSRNVLLRFYPPHTSSDLGARKKKVYEQQENEENPLRCPVKLYEFYLSKCPESVKTRNDVFYLLPERSCVPDSPVWYSTMALPQRALEKMLHRVKMVKEVNVALLTA